MHHQVTEIQKKQKSKIPKGYKVNCMLIKLQKIKTIEDLGIFQIGVF